MTKSFGTGSLASRPTPGRWLRAFVGLLMLLSAATQAAAIPVADAEAAPVVSRAADLPGAPCGPSEHRCVANECVVSTCHGSWFAVASDAGILAPSETFGAPERGRSAAGKAVLPPLHPPKNSLPV